MESRLVDSGTGLINATVDEDCVEDGESRKVLCSVNFKKG